MQVTVPQSRVHGDAQVPPSKSYTHRAILAAGYADGALVRHALKSADTRETMGAVEAFGGDVVEVEGVLEIDGFDGNPEAPPDVVDCGNSGTTMRLATGAAALVDGGTVLTGDVSLRSRPQAPLLDAVEQLGGRARSTRGNGQAPLVVEGPIGGGSVTIPGDVSSQFISALLMAGAVTDDGLEIELSTELKSAPYVDITVELLDDFGVHAERTEAGYRVDGGQTYEPTEGEYAVPGDFSSSSYLLAAGALAGDPEVEVRGVYPSAQGDSAILGILEEMGADLDWHRDDGRAVVRRSELTGTTVDVGDTPDLLPTLAVLGAAADGTTELVNAEHVRYKETDRVSAMAEELAKMGAEIEEERDALIVHGSESELVGADVEGLGDHRVVMSLAVAALVAEGETTITGAEDVDVSFPGFFDTLYDLGVSVSRE
ncbi:3-phosphoshikimate 1-carboxyvinyltransferase [Halarchaeum rubridurum]|uniref:3-phosphoshikimate 1-carboxyvinyltransferase n=1 Tax=Halarchaeum rubridurum TaxID=489911 RepID=A0A830FRH0_9EURY|nr:3-phosphoshikimate 1-carboxyvinyltransferase [Halarchaeum rubridurum]MBP1953543.1 3-phosphoshikimate 1-carboxyvinyltransferase [Halarchaeum rubridurum]GGM64460.1 3-phosphoshikimate 1-carboxyvinyltransferase [Halarchaeum rubridurum]